MAAFLPDASWIPRSKGGENPAGAIRKYWKRLVFIVICGNLGGCASQQATAFDRQMLLELEEKNTRLEAEVTRLREEKLRAASKSSCETTKDAPDLGQASEPPEDLPVVKMEPEELEPGEAIVRPAEPEPEEQPVDEDTRPVLKVRGQHEAWVYHRPLTAEDRKAKTQPVEPIEAKKTPQSE